MIREVVVKSVLNKKKNRDQWFMDDYTLNPYEGCSFNCQYCYIRGSKYGINMEERLAVKINGPEVLEKQLAFRTKKNQHGMIALASATDPYIKAERNYEITRKYLQTVLRHRFPVMMITKSELILRDLDLLQEIDRKPIHAADLQGKLNRGVYVSFSLSTLNADIASTLEPGAPSPKQRFNTMLACKKAGLKVGINCIPTLPFIADSKAELENMVSAAKDHGADYIFIGGLTLFGKGPADSKTLYYKFLERNFPQLIPDYKKLYRIFFSPPKDYLSGLNQRADEICDKYQIRRSILEAEVI